MVANSPVGSILNLTPFSKFSAQRGRSGTKLMNGMERLPTASKTLIVLVTKALTRFPSSD